MNAPPKLRATWDKLQNWLNDNHDPVEVGRVRKLMQAAGVDLELEAPDHEPLDEYDDYLAWRHGPDAVEIPF